MNGDSPSEGTTASAADPWALPGYTHERELGSGSSGRVMLAHHDATGTPVAIKYLNGGAVADTTKFRAEAVLLGDLHSPHVAELYEYVESARGAAIVMELVNGIALRTLLRQEGATAPEAALVVLKGSLLGLAAAHAAGVVHRDYKPENVLVAADGSSKLVDFGIAVRSGDTHGIAGTPVYMAPEQWAGQPASPSADVYAATATFFECLTGAKPYTGDTLAQLAVQHTEAPIPEELAPIAVRPLIRSGLAKTPEERPQSAAALVAELELIATAAYGEEWEERGRRALAALVALLPLLLLPTGGGTGAGTTALATTTVAPTTLAATVGAGTGRHFRAGRRAKLLTAAVAVALLAGATAKVASAAVGDASNRTAVAVPAPEVTTTLGPASEPASVTPSASASAASSPAPSASNSPLPDASSPAAPATGHAGGTPTPKPTLVGPPSAPPTSAPATSPAPSPVSTPPPIPVLKLHVLSITIESYGCFGRYDTIASVTVRTDGAAAGTLALNWIDGSGRGLGTTVATDVITLPQGQTQVTNRYPHTFGYADNATWWGVRAGTTPAADTGQNAYQQVAAFTCHPPA